jgi:hypothetical protein
MMRATTGGCLCERWAAGARAGPALPERCHSSEFRLHLEQVAPPILGVGTHAVSGGGPLTLEVGFLPRGEEEFCPQILT